MKKKLLMLYSSREGQTLKILHYIEKELGMDFSAKFEIFMLNLMLIGLSMIKSLSVLPFAMVTLINSCINLLNVTKLN